MLSKCANPLCAIRFRYLHEGRIFNVPVSDAHAAFGDRPSRVEHFWLCSGCAATLKIVLENGTPSVRPRFLQLPAARLKVEAEKPRAADPTAA